MEESYQNAFSEINCILKQMTKEQRDKISQDFIEFIKNNQNNSYQPHLPENVLDQTDCLKRETKIILSILYRSYFCTPEEKVELFARDEAELKEYYRYEKMFQNNTRENMQKDDFKPKTTSDIEKIEEKTALQDTKNMTFFNKIALFLKQKIWFYFRKNKK